ncbi:hypothetical protein CEXT_429691 [Caerostris extrusa]|uniref:Uncharacterized protein n=1 Tax=Caerostris extrusa TaxID=172846 RepID=A0AAV4PXU1_CAEEX|nr:hypothetical protein CEXT_429691 [Caerostris extrusa]
MNAKCGQRCPSRTITAVDVLWVISPDISVRQRCSFYLSRPIIDSVLAPPFKPKMVEWDNMEALSLSRKGATSDFLVVCLKAIGRRQDRIKQEKDPERFFSIKSKPRRKEMEVFAITFAQARLIGFGNDVLRLSRR